MDKRIKYSIELDWKNHDVDLSALHAWFKDVLNESYTCVSGNRALKVWFLSLPSEEDTFLVNAIWEELDSCEHEMCKKFVDISAN
jgi:hypothetical protein